MRAVKTLPEGYVEVYSVDLQKDRRAVVAVNLAASAIALLMLVPMGFLVPFSTLLDAEGETAPFARILVLAVLMIAYMPAHELVHGVAMRICGTEKVEYGFTGMYAYARSGDCYGKGAYIFIALAPIVFWGIVLAAANTLVPVEWFWVVYLVQVANVSGAAGDLFVTVRFFRLPKDILVRDYGVGMSVYSRTGEVGRRSPEAAS